MGQDGFTPQVSIWFWDTTPGPRAGTGRDDDCRDIHAGAFPRDDPRRGVRSPTVILPRTGAEGNGGT